MRRFWGWTLALAALLALAMLLTLPTRVGFALWHYNASFALVVFATLGAWPLLQRRRVASLALLYSGIPATATGFAMLYTKQFPYKEWLTWWHCVTSVALLLVFLAHWVHNNPRLMDFTRRLFAPRAAPGVAVAGAWVAVVGAGVLTWSDPWREGFTSENYLYLSSWAVLAAVLLAYVPWLAYRLPAMRARLAERAHRNRARALVDTSLFLAHWGALLTGFALLWLAEPLRAGPLKYVSKWWHTATSALFLALVALHVGFNARLVAAHARRVDADLAPKNP